jgi:hypothetical protein
MLVDYHKFFGPLPKGGGFFYFYQAFMEPITIWACDGFLLSAQPAKFRPGSFLSVIAV